MERRYHIQITTEALDNRVSPDALQIILQANTSQDNLAGLIGHPEYHFDDSAFPAGWAYVEAQRGIIWETVRARVDPVPAWKAFGRLSHALQDFYAHSNYLALWAETQGPGGLPAPETLQVPDSGLLQDPRLCSGRVYYPLEALTLIPALTPLIRRWLPADSHAWMNLDSPTQGPLFPYALAAARRHTRQEIEETTTLLHQKMGASARRFFTGMRS